MIHKFILERCVQCNLAQEDLESVGWECPGHADAFSATAPSSPPPEKSRELSNNKEPRPSVNDTATASLPKRVMLHPYSDHRLAASGQSTDIFAILAFATGMLGFWILPIVFTPICYICAIVSYYRLKENPNLKGKGLRITGAILGAISMLYMFYQFGIIG